MYQSSQMDLQTSKTIFTSHVYKLGGKSVHTFFALMVGERTQIQASPLNLDLNLDYGQIVGLKANRQNSIEFTQESHCYKIQTLLPSLYKHL